MSITKRFVEEAMKLLLKLDFSSETPIYEQLRRQIIQNIARGNLKPGDKLPSVRQLGEEIGINLHTVSKTYNILKDEGYLEIDRRSGAVIRENFIDGREDFESVLIEELEYLSANAYNRQIKKHELIDLIEKLYGDYEVGEKNE